MPQRKSHAATRKQTDWDGVSKWYDDLVGERGSEYHREVVLPRTLTLLAGERGQKVLDVACGQGVLCRQLAERGVEALGIDAAVGLLERARQLNQTLPADAPRPQYRLGDARDLRDVPAAHFDSAACVLAIQNVHPIQPVFDAACRALKPGGKLVLVMMHPCFRVPKASSWGWDQVTAVQFRRIDRYLLPRKEPIYAHPSKKTGPYTWTFHKPIEDYIKALAKAGLMVDVLEEWPSHKKSDSGPRAKAENVAREEIPMFMAVRAVKVQLV